MSFIISIFDFHPQMKQIFCISERIVDIQPTLRESLVVATHFFM